MWLHHRRRSLVFALAAVSASAVAAGILLVVVGRGELDPAVPTATALAIRAESRDPDFELVLETDRSERRAGEAIAVRASLRYVGTAAGTVYHTSGEGPFVFALREVGGRKAVGGATTADCVPFQLTAAQPLVTPYRKSGAVEPGDPDEAFYRDFFADPDLRLPAGTWDVTARVDLLVAARLRAGTQREDGSEDPAGHAVTGLDGRGSRLGLGSAAPGSSLAVGAQAGWR